MFACILTCRDMNSSWSQHGIVISRWHISAFRLEPRATGLGLRLISPLHGGGQKKWIVEMAAKVARDTLSQHMAIPNWFVDRDEEEERVHVVS
jgi:hypothetical protein